MVRPPHEVLVSRNVLFLGRSQPTPNALELDALIDPLRTAYPAHATDVVEGINSQLTIYTSGIQLQLIDGRRSPVFWFPIQNLYLAAANKCVNYLDPETGAVRESKFVELASNEAQESSHAPLFSIISRQSGGGPTLCYTFLTKNDASAFELVEGAMYAYNNKSGHAEGTIPSEIAAEQLITDDDGGSSEMSGTPNVINVDESRVQMASENADMFPRRLVKQQKLERIRPSSYRYSRPSQVPPLGIHPSINRSEYAAIRARPPSFPPGPIYAPGISPRPQVAVKENVKVVRPPPLYIRAPPPKVVYVKEPPKVIQTPPQVIRQVEVRDRPVPVERIKEVPVPHYIRSEPEIREVPVPVEVPVEKHVPVPVRGPTPPPEIIEKPVHIEVPVQVPVPYYVRAPTPEPQIVEVPVPYHVRAPTPPPEIVEVPVPYAVERPPPAPEIIEVPVQVPVYIESPPQIIREEPRIQEVPVPYPVEVPYQVPVEVPRPFPIPLVEKRSRKSRRREYYNDQLLARNPSQGYFLTERRRRRRRHRSSSSDTSPGRREYERQRERDYRLSNGFSGMRITEVDNRGRPLREESRRHDREEYLRPRSRERDGTEGYDFYRPNQESRRRSRRRDDADGDYYVKERRSIKNRNNRGYSSGYAEKHMPGHLSDSDSNELHQGRNDAYFY